MNDNSKTPPWASLFLTALTVLILGGLVYSGYGLRWIPERFQDRAAVFLPVLVIVGSIILLASLAYLAAGFSALGLTNRTRAVGLPEGTVRALIALILIIIFAITSIFLFSDIRNPVEHTRKEVSSGLTERQIESFLPRDQITSVRSVTSTADLEIAEVLVDLALAKLADKQALVQDAEMRIRDAREMQTTGLSTSTREHAAQQEGHARNALEDAKLELETASIGLTSRKSMLEAASQPKFDVDLRIPAVEISEDSRQFAFQILTTVSTLVVAIAGFYFGTRSVATAQQMPTPPPPVIRSITPNHGPRGGDSIPVTIMGRDFRSPTEVKLVLRDTEIPIVDILYSETRITGRLTLPADITADQWDLVVVNEDGARDTLPVAFTVE